LRLHAEEHDIRTLHRFAILGRHGDAEFLGHRGGFFGVLHSGGNALRGEQLLLQVGAQQNPAELSRA
jgi:hypothetical protein